MKPASRAWLATRKLGRIVLTMLRTFEAGHTAEDALRNSFRVAEMHAVPHSFGEFAALASLVLFVSSTADALAHAYKTAKRIVESEENE